MNLNTSRQQYQREQQEQQQLPYQAHMAFNEDSSASGHDEPWIQWFCGLKGHEMFCEVERSYIEDGFNLYGLRACVSNFSDCLDLILDRIGPDDSDDSHLTQSACTLYGLIHARYVITAHGLDAMYNKYAAKEFGTCPLVQCSGQPVLPVGLKDEMGADTVKIFCPKCTQVYHTPPLRSRANISTGVDGAAFGTTFPHLFLMTFSNLVPDPLPVESSYIPRVFGFRVHQSAQRVLPSNEAAAAGAAGGTTNKSATATTNNNNNNNNAAVERNNDPNARDLDEDEDEKSTVQGDEAAAAAASTNNTTTSNQASGASPAAAAAAPGTAKAPLDVNNNAAAVPRTNRKGKRGRKEDKVAAAIATTTAGVANTTVAPTFLMENPTKRRRRGAGNA